MDSNDCGMEGREGGRGETQVTVRSTRHMQTHSECNMKLQWTL